MDAHEGRFAARYSLWLCLALPALGQVTARQDILSLPTYVEPFPGSIPPFPVFSPGDPQVYPYTMRNGFTNQRFHHGWRALRLENDYLSCTVLPDLGGHHYS